MEFFTYGLPVVAVAALIVLHMRGKARFDEFEKRLALLKEENKNLVEQGSASGAADSASLQERELEIARLVGQNKDLSEKAADLTRQREEWAGKVAAAEKAATEASAALEEANAAAAAQAAAAKEAAAAVPTAGDAAAREAAQEELAAARAAAVAATEHLTAVQAARTAADTELQVAKAEAEAARAEVARLTTETEKAEATQEARIQRLQELAEKQVGKLQEENRRLKATASAAPASDGKTSDHFQVLTALAPFGVFETNETGRWIFASEPWARLTGLTPAESLGDGWKKSVHEADLADVETAWSAAVAGGAVFQRTFRVVTTEGALRWVAVQAARSEAGVYLGVAEDVSEQRRAEEGLKSSARCLRSVVQSAMEGIVLLNQRGDITSWNQAAVRMFGYSEEDANGRSLSALLVPDDRTTLRNSLSAAAHEDSLNTPQTLEVLALCKDGDTLPVEIAIAAWRSGEGEGEVYYTATIRDVSERRRAEDFRRAKESAEEANRAKSQFLANMSHELRTPLNAIIGFSEILHDRTFGDLTPKQDRYVGNILTSGRHLLQLINDILDLSKVEAGHVDLEYVAFPVAVAVRNVDNLVKVLLSKKNITLDTEVSNDLPVLIADQAKFKQILYNLVSNAIKFTPEGGKVTVSAKAIENGSVLQVAVKDTGIGISTEDQERVFKEFEQVDNSYARQQQGTGLGLALVKRFVEMHGGRIGVHSEGEGKGTTFLFTIPFSPAAVPAAPAESNGAAAVASDSAAAVAPATAEGVKPIILIVEDDLNASELLTHHLQMAGYTVSRTGSGQEALLIAKEINPSVVTLDVQLADGEGWDVLKELKADEATRHIPVIMVSIVEDRERAEQLGAADCFTKPVLKDRLLDAIARQIAGANGSMASPGGEARTASKGKLATSGGKNSPAEAPAPSGAKRSNGRARG